MIAVPGRTPGPGPTVVLVAAPGTLAGAEPALRRAGLRLVRLAALEPRPIEPERWMGPALQGPRPDTVLVTSRAAVDHGVRPWRQAIRRSPRGAEYWAIGPRTASALRRLGVRRVRRPSSVGGEALARALRRAPPRRVLYFRSDRAGPGLARALRKQGHRVQDRVVYRLRPTRELTRSDREALTRARLLVVTSPSGLTELRRWLGPGPFARLARHVPVVLLGDRSYRAAVRSGFRRASRAPYPTGQRFTRHVLGEVRHADP